MLRPWLRHLAPPPPTADPRETLRWVRRMEIVSGLGLIVVALTLVGAGWLRWALVGLGLFGLSPWMGAAAILRRAERRPGVLVSDPERRRERFRRVVPVMAAVYTATGAIIGAVIGGWTAALYTAAITVLAAALSAVWMRRRA